MYEWCIEGFGNRINIVTRLSRQQPAAHQSFDFANVYLDRQTAHAVAAALPVQAHPVARGLEARDRECGTRHCY